MIRGGSRSYSLVPVLFFVVWLAAGAMVAVKKRFWMDELFTWHVVTTPSAAACIDAVADQLESNPPLYFLAAWGFGRVAGTGEVPLRLFSAATMAAAFALAYYALKKPFGRRAAALGASLAFGGSTLVWEQNSEARPYAMYLLAAAALAAAHAALARRTTALRFLGAAAAHAAIVHVHALGAAYGLAALVAMILADIGGGRRRYVAYLAAPLAWATFFWWWKPFLADLDVGKPHSWIAPPALPALPEAFSNGVPVALGVAAIAAVGALTWNRRVRNDETAPADAPADRETDAIESTVRRELVILGAAFAILVPLGAFAFSRLSTSIFLDRYFIPGVVGWAALFAGLAGKLIEERAGRLPAAMAVGLIGAAAIAPVLAAWREPDHSTTGALPATAAAYPDLPVAFETAHWYLPAFHYEPRPERFHYILDWDAALAQGSDLNSSVDFKLLKSLAARFPQHRVVPSEGFLANHPRFLIIGFSVRRWSEMRVESDPAYRVTNLGQFVSLAERLPPAAPTSRESR